MTGKSLPFVFLVTCIYVSISGWTQSTSWYKCFTGKIGNYPVTMHLYKTAHTYHGNYYYTVRQQLIYFAGEDSTKPDSISLVCYLPPTDGTENFTLLLSGATIIGQWRTTTPGQSKMLPFSASEDPSSGSFDYVYTIGVIKLRPKLTGSPTASFAMESVWPKGDSPQEVFLKKIIRESFDEKNSTDDVGKIFLSHKKKFFADYLKDNQQLKDDDLKDAYSYNMDETEEMTVAYRSSGLLMLAHASYIYTGGAHGNYGTSYIPIDLVNNKKLTLDNILSVPGKLQLPKLLEKYFRTTYSVKPTDSLPEAGLFANSIEPNGNLYVTTKGISFSYLPYEIGPYAMGEISIFIPLTELSAYLQPEFRKLIQ